MSEPKTYYIEVKASQYTGSDIADYIENGPLYRDDEGTAEDATCEVAALRAEVERLKKALRASARELQYIADDDPCEKLHQTAEGSACIALAERILGPMHTWPDEPNISAPAEEGK